MRIIFSVLSLLAGNNIVFAQIEGELLDYTNRLEIGLEKDSSFASFPTKFRQVNVIDLRDDTAAVGYYSVTPQEAFKYGVKAGGSVPNKELSARSKVYYCNPSLQNGMALWLNRYLLCNKNNTEKNKLLVVVKKMWLSPQIDKPRFDESQYRTSNKWYAGVVCKLEFYLERDSVFYPLYKIDSSFVYDDLLYDYAGLRFVDRGREFFIAALKTSLEKLPDIKFDEIIEKRKKLNIQDICKKNLQSRETPILQATVFNKGVYKTLEEFKNNSPSLKEYEFHKGPLGDILYVKEGIDEYPVRNNYGYCDGTDIFINSGDKYSILIRQGRTFYFYGIKDVTRKSKIVFMKSSGFGYATNSGEKKSVYKKEFKYYELDMETGEVY
jgi:hypothetical protein